MNAWCAAGHSAHRARRRLALLGVVAALGQVAALWALPVRAEEPAEPPARPPSAKEQAQALLTEGNQLIKRGEFVAALKRFRAAHALFESPKLLINIGTALGQLGRYAEAAEIYDQYLAHPNADPKRTAAVQAALQEAERHVGRLTIVLNAQDAKLRVDGEPLRAQGQRSTVRVDPGDHTVVAEKEGLDPAIASVAVQAGQHQTVTLTLLAPEEESDGSTQRILAYTIGGVGLAGLALGGVFGGLFLSAKEETDSRCNGEVCDEQGGIALEEAQSYALVADIAVIAGGVLTAAGVVIYFTAPDGGDAEAPVGATVQIEPMGVHAALHW